MSTYHVRRSLGSLARQYFRYGFWKVRVLRAHPDSLRSRQLFPPVLVLGLAGSLAVVPVFWQLGLIVPGIYLLYTMLAALSTPHRRYLPVLSVILATMHVSWGVGFLIGLFKWGLPRLRPATIIRTLSKTDSMLNKG